MTASGEKLGLLGQLKEGARNAGGVRSYWNRSKQKAFFQQLGRRRIFPDGFFEVRRIFINCPMMRSIITASLAVVQLNIIFKIAVDPR